MVTDPAVLASLSGSAPVPYKAEMVEPYRDMEPAWGMYAVPLFTRVEIPTRLRRHETARLKVVADHLEQLACDLRALGDDRETRQEFLMLRVVASARQASHLIGVATKSKKV